MKNTSDGKQGGLIVVVLFALFLWVFKADCNQPREKIDVPTASVIQTDTWDNEVIWTQIRKKRSGRNYIRGPRGGCYYINANGNKTYVDRSFCD